MIVAPLPDEEHVMRALRELLAQRFASEPRIMVLDAGCGRQSQLEPPAPAHVVGIDAVEAELAANQDLDEKIVGDIETYPLQPAAYDLIVCWDVLEHLRRPERALDNLARALRSRGLIVIKVPNVLSVKGLVTKWTPVWLRRRIVRRMLPGVPEEYSPFPSFHRFSIAPRRLRAQLEEHGLEVTLAELYEADMQKRARARRMLPGLPWRVLEGLARATGGRIAVEPTEFLVVAQAP